MPLHIALLRGINVGGKKLVAMSSLRTMFDELGFAGAQTLLQSGNIVFPGDRRTGAALERLFEAETEKRLSATVDYFVRNSREWQTIVATNPFPKEAKTDPGHLVVMCLKQTPEASDVKTLQAAIQGREVVRHLEKQLYIVYPDGIGPSKLTNALIERELGTRGTARNWNTVLKLAALCQA